VFKYLNISLFLGVPMTKSKLSVRVSNF